MTSRPIIATFYHRKRAARPRHFARVDTAVPRCMLRLLQHGEPGDVIELAHAEFGFQIGTLKIQAGGAFTIQLAQE